MSAKIEKMFNHIYCMDCLALMKQIPDETVDLILTDPPYGISYQNQFTNHRHAVLEGDSGIPYEEFAKECYRILKDNTHAYFFTRFDCYPHHYECLKKAGFTMKNCMVVEKGTVGGIGDLKGSFANNAEWIIFCQKGRRVFNHITEDGMNQVRNIRPGLMPVGLVQIIQRQLIIQHGRNEMEFTIRQLRMLSVYHG